MKINIDKQAREIIFSGLRIILLTISNPGTIWYRLARWAIAVPACKTLSARKKIQVIQIKIKLIVSDVPLQMLYVFVWCTYCSIWYIDLKLLNYLTLSFLCFFSPVIMKKPIKRKVKKILPLMFQMVFFWKNSTIPVHTNRDLGWPLPKVQKRLYSLATSMERYMSSAYQKTERP